MLKTIPKWGTLEVLGCIFSAAPWTLKSFLYCLAPAQSIETQWNKDLLFKVLTLSSNLGVLTTTPDGKCRSSSPLIVLPLSSPEIGGIMCKNTLWLLITENLKAVSFQANNFRAPKKKQEMCHCLKFPQNSPRKSYHICTVLDALWKLKRLTYITLLIMWIQLPKV